LHSSEATSLAEALLQIARQYGFASWPKLKAFALAQTLAQNLKDAISANDLTEVKRLIRINPELIHAQIGYGNDGPLTWAAECRGVVPSPERLDIIDWLINNGASVHEGGDAPLMRASLSGSRVAVMEQLIRLGADVNAAWHGSYPIIFAPCETLDPESLDLLLRHGADPNCGDDTTWKSSARQHPGTALDYVVGTYVRDRDALNSSVTLLQNAGGRTRYDQPGVLAAICGDRDTLSKLLVENASLVANRYPSLDIGTTAGRMLTLKGATLLHVAAEFGHPAIVDQLLSTGADVNATALVDPDGLGGQTAIFHAATQGGDFGLEVVKLLVARGADLNVRCRIPGHYERLEEVFEGTVLEYANQFPESPSQARTLIQHVVQAAGNQFP
jgi:ankyrin repeat protein